jgi:hypothetical protein
MRNGIVKIEEKMIKNLRFNDSSNQWRSRLRWCPKGRGFDTQLRRLVFTQIGLMRNRIVKVKINFWAKTKNEAGYRSRDLSGNSQTRNLLRHWGHLVPQP